MRRLLFILMMGLLTIPATAGNPKLVYQFDIKEMIAPAMWRQTQQAFDEAEQMKADVILIHMNTYGGMVLDADSIRSRILRCNIPVYVFIDNNAASAGALISIACDSIFMAPGASIGAATVVNESGEKMPDKYQSYMRSTMRSTAQAQGRDPRIAEAMVDESVVIPGLIDSLHVLTFSTEEAIANHFCEGKANNIDEALKLAGISNYTISTYKESAVDMIIAFLLNPYLSSILIMIIIGGIYFELQTPGVGFPLIASIIAATLYFAPHYLDGLAENWEILVFAVGCILLLLEIFVIPGFGVAGITGIICIVGGLTLSLVDNNGFDFHFVEMNDVVRSLSLVLISLFASIAGSLFLGSRLLQGNGMFRHVVLQTDSGSLRTQWQNNADSEQRLIGKTAVAATVLRPSGKVEIDGDIYDAVAQVGFVEKGKEVRVVDYQAGQLVVI
ncbi:MAG: nodulation protein NfeD [Flavobacteriales bacterium]|nr:nodulation protein NfeD [Flavobacteriales bacterium]MCB9448952.1 nodulation protein NfeD [Flavobacteriales bacterium]